MTKNVNINCDWCNCNFEKEKKDYKYELKINPNKKFYCSKQCFNEYHQKDTQLFNCLTCQKQFKVIKVNINEAKFCSQSCSAKFNNAKRQMKNYTTKGKTKNFVCFICNNSFIGSIHCNKETLCKSCSLAKQKQTRKNYNLKLRKLNCKICTLQFMGKNAKYCSDCRPKPGAYKRSWNEIMFGHLCEKYWNCIFNQTIFHGWDADIIIPELKLAILWNGPWHYHSISIKGNSLLQIQNRDKIKIKEIINCGYTPYIIKDSGKASWRTVEEEFKKFLYYLEFPDFFEKTKNFCQRTPHHTFHDMYDM